MQGIKEQENKKCNAFIDTHPCTNEEGGMPEPVRLAFILDGTEEIRYTQDQQNNAFCGKETGTEIKRRLHENKIDQNKNNVDDKNRFYYKGKAI